MGCNCSSQYYVHTHLVATPRSAQGPPRLPPQIRLRQASPIYLYRQLPTPPTSTRDTRPCPLVKQIRKPPWHRDRVVNATEHVVPEMTRIIVCRVHHVPNLPATARGRGMIGGGQKQEHWHVIGSATWISRRGRKLQGAYGADAANASAHTLTSMMAFRGKNLNKGHV